MNSLKLLDAFAGLFSGQVYRHRASNLGDYVAAHLYEDLYSLARSPKLSSRIEERSRVVNAGNQATGIRSRRGDGTFGELVPFATALTAEGFQVARGPIATLEVGTETKVLAKAMVKQIDRVMTDLLSQAEEFKRVTSNAITVALIGVNHAPIYSSFEGEREFITTGRSGHRHPSQEGEEIERRLQERVRPRYDHCLILPFVATNQPPFEFRWLNEKRTSQEYSAVLTRISIDYEARF